MSIIKHHKMAGLSKRVDVTYFGLQISGLEDGWLQINADGEVNWSSVKPTWISYFEPMQGDSYWQVKGEYNWICLGYVDLKGINGEYTQFRVSKAGLTEGVINPTEMEWIIRGYTFDGLFKLDYFGMPIENIPSGYLYIDDKGWGKKAAQCIYWSPTPMSPDGGYGHFAGNTDSRIVAEIDLEGFNPAHLRHTFINIDRLW